MMPRLHRSQPQAVPESVIPAGHRFSAGRARFNRFANLFLLACGINYSVYIYCLQQAISNGVPVSIYESVEPYVLSLERQHARVEPEVYERVKTHGRISMILFAIAFPLKLSLILVNARLPASKSPDPLDELGPIRIASDGVAHSGGVHWPVLLPKSQVELLELQHTPAADQPVAMGLCGAMLLLLGLPLAVLLLPRIQDREILGPFCLFSLLAATGGWVVWFSIRKRYVLVAHTPNGLSRMVFHPAAGREDVIRFASSAARRHGYDFEFGKGLAG